MELLAVQLAALCSISKLSDSDGQLDLLTYSMEQSHS
jgi:hypothetical protein